MHVHSQLLVRALLDQRNVQGGRLYGEAIVYVLNDSVAQTGECEALLANEIIRTIRELISLSGGGCGKAIGKSIMIDQQKLLLVSYPLDSIQLIKPT